MEDIQLSLIDDNPLNCRRGYPDEDIKALANSLAQSGLLSPIKVRKNSDRYQIVYGHRRVRAVRLLGWNTIPAEVVAISDQEMLNFSLVENLQRKSLSDYDKALSFLKMVEEFGMNYEEIGKLVGLSKTHVCNHFRMLELFDQSDSPEKNSFLNQALNSISEHHARILLQIKDRKTRIDALNLVVTEKLSVRELSKVVQRLRSWFEVEEGTEDGQDHLRSEPLPLKRYRRRELDILEITRALNAEFELPHTGDFESFLDMHDFDRNFSIYSNFAPFNRLEKRRALDKERHWFYSVAPKLWAKVQDIHVQFFNDVALATLYVNYSLDRSWMSPDRMKVRGTVLFEKKGGAWKIVHEHWSRLDQEREDPMNRLPGQTHVGTGSRRFVPKAFIQ